MGSNSTYRPTHRAPYGAQAEQTDARRARVASPYNPRHSAHGLMDGFQPVASNR